MEFPAVAEDFSLADDAGGSPSVIRVSEPLRAVVGTVPRTDVGKACFLVGGDPQGSRIRTSGETVKRVEAQLTL